MSHPDRQPRPLAAVAVFLLLGLVITTPAARACSTFSFEAGDRVLYGRNYDWDVGAGLVVVNRTGVEKTALPTGAGEPVRWVSRLGSVTFNQYGLELPLGGMNEAGLVIEVAWLDGTRYADPDARPAISNLQWVQYQLDRHRTVAEVVASEGEVRIAGASAARVHYLVADASGAAATIELLDGRFVVHTGPALPVAVLTNHPYATALAATRDRPAGAAPPAGNGSLARFARLAIALETPTAPAASDPVDRAFALLADVADPRRTQWSIVYDQTRRVVHVSTRDTPARRQLALDDLDFACDAPVLVVDVHRAAGADLAPHLVAGADAVHAANLELIRSSFRATDFLREVPDEALAALAAYPATLPCTGER
ncbi:MAG: linear amide C-N hydrolase [Candidatus Eiseniibacteriota bacterium]|jgi:choloylglycine hydrolase